MRGTRRQFLAMAAAGLAAPALARWSDEGELARHRIRRITAFVHTAPRPKFVGKNARLGDHGDHTRDDVLWIETDRGVSGFGSGRLEPAAAEKLIGERLDRVSLEGAGTQGGVGRSDHALFDLVGKLLNRPAWSLMGEAERSAVPVYDGSIYFNDLRPDDAPAGVPKLVQEAKEGLGRGFRAFKIKVGRGHKWMPADAGFQRDVEVVRAIREAVGPDVKLMVDANNGYDLATTKRWLGEVGDCRLTFVEEMFPESPDEDRTLREYIGANGWDTLVADGESANEPAHFDPYLGNGSIDVVQPDVRAFGLGLQWKMSRIVSEKAPEMKLAPHNWGSYLGLFMQLQLGRALANVFMAECDWCRSDLFDDSAYVWNVDGTVTVPSSPGFGLNVREDVFREKYAKGAKVYGA